MLIVLSVTLAFGSENAGRTRPHRSITVLNFRTLDPNDGRVVAGIQDTLRAKLGTLDDISVRPESLEPEAVDSLTAGRQLNVDIVLTGSVQQRNGRIRVAVEMVDVHAERIVWGKIFEDETSDLFDLQDSIASDVIRKLQEAVGRRISRNLNTSRPPFAASPEFAV
ncbi:MAG: serine/threonine protein kinase [Acidobacteria bacterium OLB17]|nr:MAG: serine/threonine protein kinase [Acidobacteria bacterium OLB17]